MFRTENQDFEDSSNANTNEEQQSRLVNTNINSILIVP